MNKKTSFHSISKNSEVNESRQTPTINQDSKKIKFSPVIGVRLFAVNGIDQTIWENDYECINLLETDDEIEPPNQIENANRTDANSLFVESFTDISDESQSEGSTEKRVNPKVKTNVKTKEKPAKKRKNCGWATKTYTIEEVLCRRVREDKQVEYFIKWKGFSTKDNSWIPEMNLDDGLVSEINKLIDSSTSTPE